MKLIVARHGETLWNVQNKVLGRTDIPLNDVGIKQAEKLAEDLKQFGIRVVYASPLDRAAKTGKIVAGRNCADLVVLEELIEQNFGVFEGRDRTDEEYQQAKRNYAMRYPEGESYFDVVARVYPLLFEIRKKNFDGTAIITHGGICRIINSFFEQLSNEEFASFTMPNCGYKVYDL